MAMPAFLSAPPLSELGIGIDDLDPESLILELAEAIFPGGIAPFRNPNGYDFESLKYPEDIEHYFMHGHYINFFINVPVYSKYYTPAGTTSDGGEYPAFFDYPGIDGYKSYLATDVGFGLDSVSPNSGSIGSAINYVRTQRISQAISLYIPDTMSFGSGLVYESTSGLGVGKELLDAVDKTLGGFLSKMGNSKMGQGASGLLGIANAVGKLGGVAFNEQMLVLFRQVNLREFMYDFFFTPKSPREAESVKNIIRAFRFHAHPEAVLDYGLFYIAPGTFDIEFMHRGSMNKNIHQVKTCVLTNYTVDYAPMGWSTHVDGMPIQTRMTLTFKETETLAKQDIERGY